MLTEEKSWVAVVTYPNVEVAVAERFVKEADMHKTKAPIEFYLPMLNGKDHRYKKNPLPMKPMFPCYIFAHINKFEILDTRATKGVVNIVSFNHNIIEVPQSDIDAVKIFENTQRKFYIHETSKLQKGAVTMVTHGDFAGMTGRLVRGCKDGNFCVNISVMNMAFVVHLKRDELRPATEEEQRQNNNIKIWTEEHL